MVEDRQQMALMARNKNGSISTLGKVNVNLVGSVYDLRQDVNAALAGQLTLKGQGFVLMDQNMVDVAGANEKKVVVSEVYTSDFVFIRWLPKEGNSDLAFSSNRTTIRNKEQRTNRTSRLLYYNANQMSNEVFLVQQRHSNNPHRKMGAS